MSSPDNSQDREFPRYERPAGKYLCGRAACWGKPCLFGPKPDGQCGGTSECTPIKKGDHFECNRPAAYGGPCAEGPMPSGACCRQQPACVPRLTLRARRRLLSQLAVLVVVAGLMTSFHFGNPKGPTGAVNPGPLFILHSSKVTNGCAGCHAEHEQGLGSWVKVLAKREQNADLCLNCHTFGGTNSGLEKKAHNAYSMMGIDHKQLTDCAACHTEHHGVMASLTTITDSQCNSCHSPARQFKSFSEDHTKFPSNFPHEHPSGILFDHNISDHRDISCQQCHVVESSGKMVGARPFGQSCVGCHTPHHERTVYNATPEQDLVLLFLPKALGPIEAASIPPLMLYLLNDDGKNPARLGQVYSNFLVSLSSDSQALRRRIQERSGRQDCSALLLGLKLTAITNPASVILTNGELTNLEALEGGWSWLDDLGQLELHYHATSHADLLVKEWIDFALQVSNPNPTNDQTDPAAQKLREQFIDRAKGIGNCAKCHASFYGVPNKGETKHREQWNYPPFTSWPYTTFSHKVHLTLAECELCHVRDTNANLAKQLVTDSHAQEINLNSLMPVSNFKSIDKQMCKKCHDVGQVRQDCQLCHRYHHDHELRPDIKSKPPGDSIADSRAQKEIEDAQSAAAEKVRLADEDAKAKAKAAEIAEQERQKKEKEHQEQLAKEAKQAEESRLAEIAKTKAEAERKAKQQAAEEAEAATRLSDELAKKEAAEKLKREADEAKHQEDLLQAKAEEERKAKEKAIADTQLAEQREAKARKDAEEANRQKEATKEVLVVAKENAKAAASDDLPIVPPNAQNTGDCLRCHEKEAGVWEASHHGAKESDLAKGQHARAIMKAMSIRDPRLSPVCVKCHYSMIGDKPFASVSCESCHGAGSLWISIHNDTNTYPDKTTRRELAHQQGMINPTMVRGLVKNCLGCHNYENVDGTNYTAMINAGHPVSEFEFLRFSQGPNVKHRFYGSDGRPGGPDNLSLKPADASCALVIGQAAELVSSTTQLAKNAGIAPLEKLHKDHIAAAKNILGMISLPEADRLMAAPTEDNLQALIKACQKQDFTSKLGTNMPKESDYIK